MTGPGQGKSGQLLSGSLWMIGARWAMRLIGLVSTMILARLLAPADFGLVAMVMIAYGLFETVAYAGVDLALMRVQTDSREHFDTAWTIQLLQGLFVACAVVLAAPLAARYFGEPRIDEVMLVVAAKAVVDGAQNIGVVHFRKELDFAREFRFNLYAKLGSFLIVIAAALWWRNYWALVAGSLAGSVVTVGLSYAMHPYRPRLSLARARDLWGFSQWLLLSRIGSYLNRKCDTFIVGGAVGSTAMGTYHVATELATLPSNELVMPIRRALFPNLARIADDRAAFRRAVADSFSAVAVVCLGVSVVLWALAPQFVHVLLGSQWDAAVPVVAAMAIYGGASSLILVLEVPLWVAGRTSLSAAQAWIELAVLAPLTVWAVRVGGVEGAAQVRAGLSVAMVPLMMAFSVRAGNLGWSPLLRAAWRPVVAAAGVAALVLMLPSTWAWPALVVLVVKGALLLLLFLAFVMALWALAGRPPGFEAATLDLLARRLRRTARS